MSSQKSSIQTTIESLKRRLDLDNKSKSSGKKSNKSRGGGRTAAGGKGAHRLQDLELSLKTPRLLAACERGDLDTVKKLFRTHGSKLNLEHEDNYGRTALVYASANGHLLVVRELLRKNANREHCCEGASPLYWAVSRGHTNVVSELLLYDANADSTNEKGWTSLMNASYFGRTGIVKLLLTYGASVDMTRNDDGKSALHWACKNGRVEIVQLLLEFGANPNVQDKNKLQTPLMYAILGNHSKIAMLLLSYAADPFITNIKSKNALDIAQEMSDDNIGNDGTKDGMKKAGDEEEGSGNGSSKRKKRKRKFGKDSKNNGCDLVVLMQQAGRLYSGIQKIVDPSLVCFFFVCGACVYVYNI